MRWQAQTLRSRVIDPEQIIYLDNNATTALDPAVVEEMLPYLTKYHGNPSSGYGFGAQVRHALDLARERVAALIGCAPAEIVFTSGGTEANNSALHSALQLNPQRRHVVTTAVEHSATLRYCERLEKLGHEVSLVGVDRSGQLDLAEFERTIRPDTAIVSAMWANNETGAIFPAVEMARIARAKRVPFHTDAIQAAGKVPIAVSECPINFLSLSAHKIHGPKGVGALYVNARSAFRPLFSGGAQENSRRAGTENVAGIIGFGKAAELAAHALEQKAERMKTRRDRFENRILAEIQGSSINGRDSARLPNTSSISFAGVEAEAALVLLDREHICCSAGSACHSGSLEPSHVLLAMGFDREDARSTLRFSFSRFNTEDEAAVAADAVVRTISRLRAMPGSSRSN